MKILMLTVSILFSIGSFAKNENIQVDKYQTVRMELMAELTSEDNTELIDSLNSLTEEQFKAFFDEARLKAIHTNFNCGLKACSNEQFYRMERSIEIRNLKDLL